MKVRKLNPTIGGLAIWSVKTPQGETTGLREGHARELFIKGGDNVELYRNGELRAQRTTTYVK